MPTKYAENVERARASGAMHASETWSTQVIRETLQDAGFFFRTHGAWEYCVYVDSNLPKDKQAELNRRMGLSFKGLPWRSGELRYGYHKDLPPHGWFYTPQGALHNWLMEHEIEPEQEAPNDDA